MTAILVVERTTPARPRAHHARGARATRAPGVGLLPKKKLVPVEGLLAGMLLPSGNDAALALADHVAGHDRAFVKLMNARARTMGLSCTHYSSSYGLPDTNRPARPTWRRSRGWRWRSRASPGIVRQPQVKVRFPIKGGFLYLNTTNPLLHDTSRDDRAEDRLDRPGRATASSASSAAAGARSAWCCCTRRTRCRSRRSW